MKKCKVCGKEGKRNKYGGVFCSNCFALSNFQAPVLNYNNGGGQDVPKSDKENLRIKNAKERFKIIKTFTNSKLFFVDIGSGSGEMLEASKKVPYLTGHLGFEPNKFLYKHSITKKRKTILGLFEKSKIKIKKTPKLIALCHVLEHMEKPFEFMQTLYNSMDKNDIAYIEVPSYEGASFLAKNFKWKLWYHEHHVLYSTKTFEYMNGKIGFKKIKFGRRIFYHEFHKEVFFKALILHPLKYLTKVLKMKSFPKNRQDISDIFMQDYIYIIIRK